MQNNNSDIPISNTAAKDQAYKRAVILVSLTLANRYVWTYEPDRLNNTSPMIRQSTPSTYIISINSIIRFNEVVRKEVKWKEPAWRHFAEANLKRWAARFDTQKDAALYAKIMEKT